MAKFRTFKDPGGDRARVECMDEQESDVQVEVVELADADTGEPFWAVNVAAFGPRPVRVFTNGSLEQSLEWSGGEWG